MKRKLTALIALVLCAGSVLILSSCSGTNDPAELIDTVCNQIDEYETTSDTNIKGKIDKNLSKLGIGFFSSEKHNHFDDSIIDSYLEDHTPEEFLKQILKIIFFCSDGDGLAPAAAGATIGIDYWHAPYRENCMCQSLTEVLQIIINRDDFSDYISALFDKSLLGTEGYYTEHPNAEPQAYEKEVIGKFYDRDGTNVHYETKYETGVVDYYGDYAYLSVTEPYYNEGAYGWYNGTFYDELPSWKTYSHTRLY